MSTVAPDPVRSHPAERSRKRERDSAALADYVGRVVDEAPPLTFDPLDTIGAILRGARPADVVSA